MPLTIKSAVKRAVTALGYQIVSKPVLPDLRAELEVIRGKLSLPVQLRDRITALMDDPGDEAQQGLSSAWHLLTRHRCDALANRLLAASRATVQTGPFAGMKYVCQSTGALCPKLLGCYESELHPAIAKAISRQPKNIINVGCAEGYYAIGMARAKGGAADTYEADASDLFDAGYAAFGPMKKETS